MLEHQPSRLSSHSVPIQHSYHCKCTHMHSAHEQQTQKVRNRDRHRQTDSSKYRKPTKRGALGAHRLQPLFYHISCRHKSLLKSGPSLTEHGRGEGLSMSGVHRRVLDLGTFFINGVGSESSPSNLGDYWVQGGDIQTLGCGSRGRSAHSGSLHLNQNQDGLIQ